MDDETRNKVATELMASVRHKVERHKGGISDAALILTLAATAQHVGIAILAGEKPEDAQAKFLADVAAIYHPVYLRTLDAFTKTTTINN